MKYRRAFAPGGSFFFTVVTEQRRPILASQDAVAILKQAIRTVRNQLPFTIDAIVILHDHMHTIYLAGWRCIFCNTVAIDQELVYQTL